VCQRSCFQIESQRIPSFRLKLSELKKQYMWDVDHPEFWMWVLRPCRRSVVADCGNRPSRVWSLRRRDKNRGAAFLTRDVVDNMRENMKTREILQQEFDRIVKDRCVCCARSSCREWADV
jgi:hypothetical protein